MAKKLFLVVLAVLLVGSFTFMGCDSDDDDATCSDAVNNIWNIFDGLSNYEKIEAMVDLCNDAGIYFNGGEIYWGTCGGNDAYVPYESTFMSVMMEWCEDGYVGDTYLGEWDQEDIDCHADADDYNDLQACDK